MQKKNFNTVLDSVSHLMPGQGRDKFSNVTSAILGKFDDLTLNMKQNLQRKITFKLKDDILDIGKPFLCLHLGAILHQKSFRGLWCQLAHIFYL